MNHHRIRPLAARMVLLLLLALVLILVPAPALNASTIHPARGELLQFTAGGHVLGFQRDAVYVASASHALKIEFVGGAGAAPIADAPASSAGRALPLSQVAYPNVWEGISVSYQATADGIAKSAYIIAAGADVEQIRLRYNVPVELDAGRNLIARFATGEMRERAPIAWQDIDGQRIAVQIAFRLIDSSIENQKSKIENALVGFALGEYDRAYPLVIDPTLEWNTFLGGSGDDNGYAIAVDGSGNVYVAGSSTATWGSPVRAYTSGYDAFAAKLNSSGVLQWNTFLGGSGDDDGFALALDGSAPANVYVAGWSNATWGSPVRAYTIYQDAFAAKLNSNGVLQWNTFLGGSNADFGRAIAVDWIGNVYVAGDSDANWGSPVVAYTSLNDAFVAKLNSSGVLQWNTFLGGMGMDYGTAIAVDGSLPANVYVSGRSSDTWGSTGRPYSGFGYDAFAAKLNSNGVLQWNTFLGASGIPGLWGNDYGFAIALDGSAPANVYVAGYSDATWGSPVRAYTSGYDAFAARLSTGTTPTNTPTATPTNTPTATPTPSGTPTYNLFLPLILR